MKYRFYVSLIVLSFTGSLLAQTPIPKPSPSKVDEQAAKEKAAKQGELAEQVMTEAPGLRLGLNRAFVLAKVGTLVWNSDQKTAREMFQGAVNELVNAQMLNDTEAKGSSDARRDRTDQRIRPAILLSMAAFDGEFALNALYRTRPVAIQDALVAQANISSGKIGDRPESSSSLAQNELNLEQRLISIAATQNPQLAIDMLRDSIKKDLTSETLSLLKKLFTKDPELANSLASDTLSRLSSATFSLSSADQGAISLALNVLNDYIRPRTNGAKELKFDDPPIRSLANKLLSYYIGLDSRYAAGRLPQLLKIAEKLSPGSIAALKKMEKASGGRGGYYRDSATQKLLSRNLTPAQLLAAARDLPDTSRSPVYQMAANKMAETGDVTGAIAFLNASFSGRSLENAIGSLNWWYAGFLMNQSKWSEAENVIDQMSDNNRLAALMTLATRAFAKDPTENRTIAVNALRKVRAALPVKPTDQVELHQFFQLSGAYAGIDPDEAFRTLDTVVPMVNDLADASAVVQEFRNDPNVSSGEFIIGATPSFGFQFDRGIIASLAKADLDQTIKLIDQFTRREMRIALKLDLAENGLR